MNGAPKVLAPGELLAGGTVSLRLITAADCLPRYLGWLQDPEVNRFLETRWQEQSIESISQFAGAMLASPDNYLFAIVESQTRTHIGNLKVGPVNRFHAHADVSYFIGEKQHWGKGYATTAITLAASFAFERLKLNRVQAGVYQDNVGSARALEKAGFRFEGRFRKQLRVSAMGEWQDHVWYGLLREEWEARKR